jgi:TPP-dependent pyruvate/acetoin dehydrogenase alpha subunit
LLSPDRLKQLYSTMLYCRLIEEEARRLFDESAAAANRRAVDSHEATEVGAIIGLQATDCVALRQRRNFVGGFILGAPLKQVFSQICSQATTLNHLPARAKQRPKAPLIISGTPSASARINISTGVALAYKTQKKPGVVVVFSGEDATALASWREALDFAAANKLPVVHVVQDELGSESASYGSQSSVDAAACDKGVPTLIVDADDVVAVYRVVHEAIRRARQGHGPALIACKAYRWLGYPEVAPLPHQPSLEEAASEKSNDPISRMEIYLEQKGLWSTGWKEKLVKNFRRQLDAAMPFAQRPSPSKAFGNRKQSSEDMNSGLAVRRH